MKPRKLLPYEIILYTLAIPEQLVENDELIWPVLISHNPFDYSYQFAICPTFLAISFLLTYFVCERCNCW